LFTHTGLTRLLLLLLLRALEKTTCFINDQWRTCMLPFHILGAAAGQCLAAALPARLPTSKLSHVNKQLGTQHDRFLTKTTATTTQLGFSSRL
jgi:hypothetical protein